MSVMEGGVLTSLVAQAATGDEVAFARIVAAYHDDLIRLCFIVCHDTDLAQEGAHNAWSVAWRKLATIREPERLRPWLLAIAANEARQLARRRGRQALREIPIVADEDGGGPSGAGDPADRVATLDLSNALARLDRDDRVVLAMSAAGLSSTEIGRALGMSPSGVRSKLGRLLGRLREDLRDG